MNKFSTCSLAILATLALVTLAGQPAYAQTTADTFAGPRAEITVGFDQLRFDLDDIGGTGRSKTSDLGYGAAIGYDLAVNPTLLIGVEGAVNLSDTSYATSSGYLRARRELTLAGRIGMPVGDNALLYGKVGYANLQVREQDLVGDARRNLDGVTLGAGAEVKITPSAYLKGEYRYTDYAGGYFGNKVLTGVGVRF